jgi:hypothetical protein
MNRALTAPCHIYAAAAQWAMSERLPRSLPRQHRWPGQGGGTSVRGTMLRTRSSRFAVGDTSVLVASVSLPVTRYADEAARPPRWRRFQPRELKHRMLVGLTRCRREPCCIRKSRRANTKVSLSSFAGWKPGNCCRGSGRAWPPVWRSLRSTVRSIGSRRAERRSRRPIQRWNLSPPR